MPKLIVVNRDGEETTVDADNGLTVMEVIRDNGFDELLALCGGCCSCATCHVLISAEWQAKLEPRSDQEESMLDLNPDRTDESRLSCQITMTDDLDGITINLPEFQY